MVDEMMTFDLTDLWEALRETHAAQAGAFDDDETDGEELAKQVREYFGSGVTECLVSKKASQDAARRAHSQLASIGGSKGWTEP